MEAESRFARLVQFVPVSARRFQQRIGTNNIGFDEIGRPRDGAIDMALGRQVHHGIRLMQSKHPVQLTTVADIYLLANITLTGSSFGQGLQIPRIGEFVEVDHDILRVSSNVKHNRRPDKASATSDKDFHKYVIEIKMKSKKV